MRDLKVDLSNMQYVQEIYRLRKRVEELEKALRDIYSLFAPDHNVWDTGLRAPKIIESALNLRVLERPDGQGGNKMTREKLLGHITEEMEQIKDLFQRKNGHYGMTNDGLYSFRETAKLMFGVDDVDEQYFTLLTLASKHWVALCSNHRLDEDAEERLRDMVLYCLLGLAMIHVKQAEIEGDDDE